MDEPIVLCGRVFTPELIEYLKNAQQADPEQSKNDFARLVCRELGWYAPDGRPCVSSAKVALRKLRGRGLLPADVHKKRAPRHRLKASGAPLPALSKVPQRVDQVQHLHLYLVSGQTDPLHALWNDLIIQQHPCGDAPLVGAQLRYLIGSDHGWLGAIGFGPAAFVLGARDRWINWSTSARTGHLREVLGLSRFLIRQEVRCTHLASKVLGMVLARVADDWERRYAVRPLLVETFVDRAKYTGNCFSAANWRRIGVSTGRGRLGAAAATKSIKDIWVYELKPGARTELQRETSAPLTPRPLLSCLTQESWCAQELATLDLGDIRLKRRAAGVLEARWANPQDSFYGSFGTWAEAMGAYRLIENETAPVTLDQLLGAHSQATQARMAAEPVVLLPQDTSTLNYTGLKRTTGLGPLGEDKGQGLWLHSQLAYRPDGIPLGVLNARCWARPKSEAEPQRGRNAESIDEKESERWVESLAVAGRAARRMIQTQLVSITDREGDLYELHDAVQIGPANLHILVRAQHNRLLESHEKLWSFMATQPVARTYTLEVPRRRHQPARQATLELRYAEVTIQAPQVGAKKSWPPLRLWAVWVHEPHPPAGVEPLDWMLLTDMPLANADQAYEKVLWYRVRWGIEEWHRVLKTGCNAEGREFETAEHLKRALAFDMIAAWRLLACLKIGRALPQLPARLIYTEEELLILWALQKKLQPSPGPDLGASQPSAGLPGRIHGSQKRRSSGSRESGDRNAQTDSHTPRLGASSTLL